MTSPTTQPCPACGALVNYEGHGERHVTLVPHRFHCHACGRVYVVRSTSHKPPRFPLAPRHEVREVIEHPPEEVAAPAAPAAEAAAPAAASGTDPAAAPEAPPRQG